MRPLSSVPSCIAVLPHPDTVNRCFDTTRLAVYLIRLQKTSVRNMMTHVFNVRTTCSLCLDRVALI